MGWSPWKPWAATRELLGAFPRAGPVWGALGGNPGQQPENCREDRVGRSLASFEVEGVYAFVEDSEEK